MRRVLSLVMFLSCCGSLFAEEQGPAEKSAIQGSKPNILVIMADDVGWMNVSSYGGDIMGVKMGKTIEGIQSQLLKVRQQN